MLGKLKEIHKKYLELEKQINDPEAMNEIYRQVMFRARLTLFRFRDGNAPGGFCEIGVGTNTTLSGGISYQLRD